jgi:hypothetical protein
MADFHNKPMAAEGLTSYRYRGRYGWCMIGASDLDDALNEAWRCTDERDPARLEVWNGTEYVKAF